jgi:hypothetical protein
LNNLNDLIISKEESDQYKWITPTDCLKEFKDKTMDFSPPIYFIIKILSKLINVKNIEKYLEKLED